MMASDRQDPLTPDLPQCDLIDAVRAETRLKAKLWKVAETVCNDKRQPHVVLGSSNVHSMHTFTSPDGPITIWEFVMDPFRVPFFYDEGQLILCTHSYRKKTQQAPKEEQGKAEGCWYEYKKLKDNGGGIQ